MPVVYLAGLSDEMVDSYQIFCDNFGLLFQITDDILDVIGEEQKVGKTLGKDSKDGKVTYVSLYGLDGANKYADDAENACLEQLHKIGEDGYLSSLVKYIRRREK
jgi:geranylgeranyl diphosphate synthase type II